MRGCNHGLVRRKRRRRSRSAGALPKVPALSLPARFMGQGWPPGGSWAGWHPHLRCAVKPGPFSPWHAFPRVGQRFGAGLRAQLDTAPGCHRPEAKYRRLPSLLSRRFPNLPAVEPGGAQDLQIIRRFGDWRFGGSVKRRPPRDRIPSFGGLFPRRQTARAAGRWHSRAKIPE